MARARNIKPGFFSNDVLAECSPMARLLFIGLWTVADREGILENRPKRIKGQVFPFDNCDIDQLIDELVVRGFVVRYEANGHKLLYIPNFGKHQRFHVNEAKSQFVPPLATKATSTCHQGDKRGAPRCPELGIRNSELGNMNEELGIPELATCLDANSKAGGKKPRGPSLTAEQIDDAVERAVDLRRKVRVKNHEEAFALCRVAVLEITTLARQYVDDAAEQTFRAKPAAPAGYFTGVLLDEATKRGEDLRDAFNSVRFPRDRVREVLEANVTEKAYR